MKKELNNDEELSYENESYVEDWRRGNKEAAAENEERKEDEKKISEEKEPIYENEGGVEGWEWKMRKE